MSDQTNWMEVNEQFLAASMKWLRLLLEEQTSVAEPETRDEPESSGGWFKQKKAGETKLLRSPSSVPIDESVENARQEMVKLEQHEPAPALVLLRDRLGLSRFDSHILLLCTAMELDNRIASLCARAQGDLNKPWPTFGLAFSIFKDPDWNALSPHAPLRYWRLLEINQPGAMPLTAATLSADERIVNYLKGLNYLDDRLTPIVDPMVAHIDGEELPPSQQQAVDQIIERVTDVYGVDQKPVIELLGHDANSKRLIAAHVAYSAGLNLQTINLKTIPSQIGDLETFIRLWQRESLLMPLALFIDIDGAGETEKATLKRFLERSNGVVFIDIEDAKTETVRNRFSIEVNKPTLEEQEHLWDEVLEGRGNDQPQRLAEQFSFDQSEIRRLANNTLGQPSEDKSSLAKDLWHACRLSARAGMEQLARRIDAKANWNHLVLPPEQKALLRQITDQVAQRNRVYEEWGFREQMNRGLGINALFAGESGTGKTMAAEVIANELKLDLYRIDLSAVVSKYIGETEKNLRKLFDAAEDSGAILFFDEADALFGKRSEVKDSHDRYANIEINYLLQRMEAYRGLAILATNMKSSLDKAFVRRLRFILDFPFPGVEERKEIWEKVFPLSTPVDESLDFERLAKLNLTGGSIHNVALNAAFLSAQEGNLVTMPFILNAARSEFKKLERPAKESDFKWQGPTGVVV